MASRFLLWASLASLASALVAPGGHVVRRAGVASRSGGPAPSRSAAARTGGSAARRGSDAVRARLLPKGRPDAEECAVDDGELSLGELLERYGVVALLFHFSVWLSFLSVGFAALSFVDPSAVIESLPDALRERLPAEATEGAAAAGGLVKAQIVLALTEVVGPARLAFTVAMTPAVSTTVRRSGAFCDFENALNAQLTKLPFFKSKSDAGLAE